MNKEYGHFTQSGYRITERETPRHWYNYLYNDEYITFVSQVGCFLQDLFGKKCRTFWRILHLQIGENCRGTGRPFFTDRIPVQA